MCPFPGHESVSATEWEQGEEWVERLAGDMCSACALRVMALLLRSKWLRVGRRPIILEALCSMLVS